MPRCELKWEMLVDMKRIILLISILSLLFAGCQSEPAVQYTYRQPGNINDGFEVGTLNEVNIDSVVIEKAVRELFSQAA